MSGGREAESGSGGGRRDQPGFQTIPVDHVKSYGLPTGERSKVHTWRSSLPKVHSVGNTIRAHIHRGLAERQLLGSLRKGKLRIMLRVKHLTILNA
eukprot:jgi/Mesen1/9007/ME000563S08324